MQPESHTAEALSYQCASFPVVLSKIFSPNTSVALWQRPEQKVVQAYFRTVAKQLGQGIRQVFPISTLAASLNEILPDALGKAQAVADIYLVADMLTCLFDCEEVGLRLVSVEKAMCPRFHVDNVPVRLITTFTGEGTQWLPNEWADLGKLGKGAGELDDARSGLYTDDTQIQQMSLFDVALLKGAAFDAAHPAAIHRSCQVASGQQRVLLTLDPL